MVDRLRPSSPVPSAPLTARQRALRVPLDYWRRTTLLQRVKWWLTALVVLVTTTYGVVVLTARRTHSPSGLAQLSPGPLSFFHQWGADRCESCHEPGVPLRAHAAGSDHLERWLSGRLTPAAVTIERKCLACHPTAAHHSEQREDERPSCTACHHEHRGRAARLNDIADRSCADCHRQIATHRRSGMADSDRPVVNVNSWADHPPFRSLADPSPRSLHFNHRLHLLPGLYPRGALPTAPQRLGSVDRAAWAQWGYPPEASPDTVIQLTCAACHETATAGMPTNGAYYQPVSFSRHCAACHGADLAVVVPTEEGAVRAAVPHGWQANELRTYVAGRVAEPTSAAAPPPASPLPGRAPRRPAVPPDLTTRLAQAESQLASEQRCGKCHLLARPAPLVNETVPTGSASLPEPLTVVPPSAPAVWLPGATFSHLAHRASRCQECHLPEAFAWEGNSKPPRDSTRPILPAREVCQRCHGQVAPTSMHPPATAGARADCITCHRYHGADQRPTGRHGTARKAEPPVSERTPPRPAREAPSGPGRLVEPTTMLPLVLTPVVQRSRTTSTESHSSMSCAAAGCHGAAPTGEQRGSSTAWTQWALTDPHRRALDVLYGERAVEIYRQLTRDEAPLTTASARERFAILLRDRCVGCHATTDAAEGSDASDETDPEREPVPARGPLTALSWMEQRVEGISCVTCHPQTPGWRDRHFLESAAGREGREQHWAESHWPRRVSRCYACHAGDLHVGSRVYSVDHEMIAAGHPRLRFEMSSYLDRYPPHWDSTAIADRYRRATGGFLHVGLWRLGQEQAVRQQLLRMEHAVASAGRPASGQDWSHYACGQCHHTLPSPTPSLGADSPPRTRPTGWPQLVWQAWPGWVDASRLDEEESVPLPMALATLRGELIRSTPTSPLPRAALDAVRRNLASARPRLPVSSPDLMRHGQELARWLRAALGSSGDAAPAEFTGAWDDTLAWLQAAEAITRDVASNATREELHGATRDLRAALARPEHFGLPAETAAEDCQALYQLPLTFQKALVTGELRRIAAALEDESLYKARSLSP